LISPPIVIRVRDEKPARALDGFDLKSLRDNAKFSKPFTFSATSGTTANAKAIANSTFFFIFIAQSPLQITS
jgi:hypothetical protein